jgi:stage V sporulation protein SpoVS
MPQKYGSWAEKILHSFGGTSADADVIRPATLVSDAAGNIYGTSSSGGIGDGTVFEISPTPAAIPVFSPAAGTYAPGQLVKITEATAGAKIYYTVDGGTPTTSSSVYVQPVKLTQSQTMKAIAVAPGYATSGVAVAKYVIAVPAKTPVISPKGGAFGAAVTVKISDATAGASIYYTTNGAAPTTAAKKYTAPFSVATNQTVKAIAAGSGFSASAVASATFTVKTAEPQFSVKAGTYLKAQSVKITCATVGAAIYYTTNGTTPTAASRRYSAAIAVAATQTIKAIAVAKNHTSSLVASAAYIIKKPAATPIIKPVTGTYSKAQTVTITDATPRTTIYYTLNGATPTAASSKYTRGFTVTKKTTVKAIAVATGFSNSAVASVTITID